ncbi:MAG: hypothetical protein ASARMPREDX12_007779 [Alectoria sarmentosa]|nr:MAG: hypothetical protein ASARMPREDX12_007779 [Alectoria sarmentosa]
MKLDDHIPTEILMQLDAVNLEGNQTLKRHRRAFESQAQRMLSMLDEAYASCHASCSDEEADGQRAEKPQAKDYTTNPAKGEDKRPGLSDRNTDSAANANPGSSHDHGVPGSSSDSSSEKFRYIRALPPNEYILLLGYSGFMEVIMYRFVHLTELSSNVASRS